MRNLRKGVFAATLVFATLVCPRLAEAQSAGTGALVGTITDVTNALLPDVKIEITNEATGEKRVANSDQNGRYALSLLIPGSYRVEATKKDFKSAVESGIHVNVTETARLDIEMTLGTVTEKVTVVGKPGIVQTESSTLGRVVNERAMEGLPLVTRNYTQIIGLSPGVEADVTNATALGSGNGGLSPAEGTSGIFVQGARATDNNFQIDGVSVVDNEEWGGNSGGAAIPNPDTIEEFKVQTGLYDASFGHNAGANVNIVTKGGSNQFHGNAFEFFRNEDLNANDFFFNLTGQPRPILKQNQFGYTLGGPVQKDKLLFFTSYQGTRQINGASTGADTTCTADMVSPPFTNDRSAAALGAMFAGQAGAYGGVPINADGSNINPVALSLLQYKLPNGSYLIPSPQIINPSAGSLAIEGLSTFSEACHFNEDQFMTNMDYLQSPKSKLSGRFFFSNGNQQVAFPSGTIGAGNIPGSPETQNHHYRVLSLTHTYTFNTNVLNQFEIGYDRIFSHSVAGNPFTYSTFGINTDGLQQLNELPNIIIGGSAIGVGMPIEYVQNSFQVGDSISYIHGRHFMRFGGGTARLQNNFEDYNAGGILQFISWPDFLLGMSGTQNGSGVSNVIFSFLAEGLFDRAWRAWEHNLYYQDTIKLARTLTLNVGLRYEHLGLYDDQHGRNASFDPAVANPNPPDAGSIEGYVVASNYPGTVPAGVTKSTTPWAVKGDGTNTWGPRLGFSWQLPQTTRFVLRGGYGTYYSRPTGESFALSTFSAPFTAYGDYFGTINQNMTLADPFPGPVPVIPSFPAYTPSSSISEAGVGQGYRPGIVQQFTLNVQTELAKDFLAEVGYVGTHGTHLLEMISTNQALSATPENPIRGVTTNTVDNIPLRVPIEGITPASLSIVESEGYSWYNALEASLTKRFSHGLQFLASYTFSKTLDTSGANVTSSAGTYGNVIGDQNNPGQRYGLADYGRPNRFMFSFVYDLPSPKTKGGLVGHLLGGWETSGTVTIQSGQQTTIQYTNANNVFGIQGDRASLAPGCSDRQLSMPGAVDKKLNAFFNAACITSPAVIGADGIGTGFGDIGVGAVRGPDQRDVDLAIMKRTHIGWPGETANLDFRIELFNAFNTPQFAGADSNYSDPTFGVISSTSVNPRVLQLALKFNF
jgi:hypothetical protein